MYESGHIPAAIVGGFDPAKRVFSDMALVACSTAGY